ncbi:hypothetical protein [Roseovarius sp. EL26]|uniref:hypothetical protein n=1 Tax=Roseovarius sp. EL26 TaxID=2126672 RepID=UPI000EA16837|nr:hypothetical protein [Roseovarius sp. EL26]
MNDSDFQMGVRNLLMNCAKTQPDEKILIVGEDGENTFFEPELAGDVARAAERMGLQATHILAKPVASANEFPESVLRAMEETDITIFFSRLGDQVRFLPSLGAGRNVMTYILTRRHLAASFGTANFSITERTLEKLIEVITAATHYRITCQGGTDMTSDLSQAETESDFVPFSLKLFPTMIFPPIGFRNLNGTLKISDFTLSSSTRAYDDSVLNISSPILADVHDGLMTDFDGDAGVIQTFQEQCIRAAGITGGEPFRLNSWHTGVNPFTFFEGNPHDDLERWGTVAYGSPRYTHIHAAGKDPGDLAIQLFDASISFDDEWIWKDGRFVFLDRPDMREMLDANGQKNLTSDVRLDIGM